MSGRVCNEPVADGTTSVVDRAMEALRRVIGESQSMVGLHEPCFCGREWAYVKDCLDTGWVSSVGGYVERFEKQLVDITGCGHAVATSSGTAALHTCLLLAGVNRGDEVLIPSLSFVATANAVTYTGAIPHFVDCDEGTLGIDPDKIAAYLREIAHIKNGHCYNRNTGKRITALVAVHVFGHPCRIDAIAEVAAGNRITLIEDAAESLGSTYRGLHTGRWGRLAALSFNGNKTATTGGGGAVLTDDKGLAEKAKHVTTTAKVVHRWRYWHDQVGYNYRLPNLNAAVGCAQLEQLQKLLNSKRELARRYKEEFANVAGIRFVSEPSDSSSNYWLCALLLDNDHAGELELLLRRTNDAGIMTRPVWSLLSSLPIYAGCPHSSLSVSENLARRLINIPSSPGLCLAAVD